MEMEGEVPIANYVFCKAIVLAKVDPLGHSTPTQRESFAVQMGQPKGHVKNDQEEQGWVHL